MRLGFQTYEGNILAKLSNVIIIFCLVTLAAVLAGCGSGGGGSSSGGTSSTTATQAVVTISTEESGTVSSLPIIGIEVTLALPPGVTVSADASGQTESGIVKASGVAAGASIIGNYTPATATTPGTVKIVVIKSTGFGAGEFVTVTCNRNGASFSPSDFSLSDFKAVDHYGITITGLALTHTVH